MNKFSASDHQHEWGPAVKDEMMVTLRDMKIRKCLFDEEMNGEKESVILEDLVLVTEVLVSNIYMGMLYTMVCNDTCVLAVLCCTI